MAEKTIVAIFLGGYLPAKKYGGPVTSIANLVEQIGDEIQFYIISNNHEFREKTPLPNIKKGWNQVGNAKVLYIKESEYTVGNFTRILQDIKPNVIYLSSVFYYHMNIPAIKAARKNDIPIILAPRGEICEGAIKIGGFKKKLFITLIKVMRLFDDIYFHVTSDEEEQAVKNYFNPSSQKLMKMPNMPCSLMKRNTIKKEKGYLSLIYLSRIVEKKNLLYAIERVKQCKCNISLDIYGPLESEAYWERCNDECKHTNDNISIKYRGTVDPGEARNIFSNYNAFIFPTLSENYGHVIVEAISSSCPIIISEGTTPWDDINGKGGYVINLDNEEEWSSIIDMIAGMGNEEYCKLRNDTHSYAKMKLNIDELAKKYFEMFDK